MTGSQPGGLVEACVTVNETVTTVSSAVSNAVSSTVSSTVTSATAIEKAIATESVTGSDITDDVTGNDPLLSGVGGWDTRSLGPLASPFDDYWGLSTFDSEVSDVTASSQQWPMPDVLSLESMLDQLNTP